MQNNLIKSASSPGCLEPPPTSRGELRAKHNKNRAESCKYHRAYVLREELPGHKDVFRVRMVEKPPEVGLLS